MSRFLFAFEYFDAVKAWTIFGQMLRKPVQVTISFPICKVRQSLRCITVLEESRTTTIAGNRAITTAPAQDGLTIIIFDSVEGNARTVPNGIDNKGRLYLGFLTGARLKISEIFVILIHFCLFWYFNNDADTLICQ
jgi:hypothetical protein